MNFLSLQFSTQGTQLLVFTLQFGSQVLNSAFQLLAIDRTLAKLLAQFIDKFTVPVPFALTASEFKKGGK